MYSPEIKPDNDDQTAAGRALVLVAIQLAALVYLALTGRRASPHAPLLALELASLALGLWAVVVVRPWNVNVAPTVRAGAQLVTRGPYRWIRHPMYTSLMMLTGAWIADDFTPVRALVWAAFLVNMLVKVHTEERYLAERFPHFVEYRRRTRRLIPFVY